MNGLNENKTISKTSSGFPDYLDFEKLRSEGMDYLGKLSGKIWTDHNVHDPGITILEMLCYALLDLGYRTSLPAIDIFTRDPENKSKDNNFFTPSEILTCNPLTITDFRKLLIDIEGVKNAWLEVVDDFNPREFCPQDVLLSNTGDDVLFVEAGASGQQPGECCKDYLNGLYHVYIETEQKYEDDADQKKYEEDEIIPAVRKALMAHRNLCEDFIDVKILCRLPVGICADIELEDDADVETVYVKVVERLQDFFSPSPRFYTLQQLLEEKNKNIEDIFAGRPYNIPESHGFVDTVEFGELHLRKEIHLSDVYSAIFEVTGVRKVQNLRLQTCDGTSPPLPKEKWIFPLKENHIPEFSVNCSGFKFSRYGMSLTPDVKKYASLFELNFRHTGKILYKQPSPYLDAEIPKGVYRPDLGDYYSIQNEFPRVYGIAEGGLPADADNLRKAKALQLKAYLLFFDQLLANYLSQLKNITSLFAFSLPDKQQQVTYFTSLPDTVPELQPLLRFKINEAGESSLGGQGTILAIPVGRVKLQALTDSGQIAKTKLEKDFPQYYFPTSVQSNIAVNILMNDLLYGDYEAVIESTTDECFFFYLLTSSCDFALISRRYYKNEQEAKNAAASLKYAGAFSENYKTFIDASGNAFSFDVELNLSLYSKYLQLIAEDRELYKRRRTQFLDHLLSRFAERFTDYALLSYGFYDNDQLDEGTIKNKERFLENYDDLSSNRGKAYDYYTDGWNNDNVSGLEKKFKALAGIDNWQRHNLCHFEVYKYKEKFVSSLKIAGQDLFSIDEEFDAREDAQKATQSLFRALSVADSYNIGPVPHERAYAIQVRFGGKQPGIYRTKYEKEEDAKETSKLLVQMFSKTVPADNIFISRYRYQPVLKDHAGNAVATFAESTDNEDKAMMMAIKRINDKKKWSYLQEAREMAGQLYCDPGLSANFIDIGAFKEYPKDDIIDKPGKFTYEVLDRNNQFKLRSVQEFDSRKEASDDCYRLLQLLTDKNNYRIDKNNETGKYAIAIVYKEMIRAVYDNEEYNSEKEAVRIKERIENIVKQHQYNLAVDKVPDRWKFIHRLGIEYNEQFIFECDNDGYESENEAKLAAEAFSGALTDLEVNEKGGELMVAPKRKKNIAQAKMVFKELSASREYGDIKKPVSDLLEMRKEIETLFSSTSPESFDQGIHIDEKSQCGQYVYHLVDNDNPLAFSPGDENANTAADAESKRISLINQAVNGYDFLEICLGGDIINKRKDKKTKKYTYHYQLKTLHRYFMPGDTIGRYLVLFESTKGYSSSGEAEQAFQKNYLLILDYASDLYASLDKKLLSDTEISIYKDDECIIGETIAFIPKETLDYLGREFYPDEAKDILVKLAKSYPVRIIKYNPKENEFKKRFPCLKKEGEDDGGNDKKDNCIERIECAETDLKYVYYFVLFNKQTGQEDWQSVRFYETPERAWKDFYFLLVLLRFEGNYYVDCDPCDGLIKVYIREVLAESAERFVSPAIAWSREGIQKFICVAQTKNAFYTCLEENGCCYTFYLACGTTPLIHPCKYDTPQIRDKAMDLLYYAFQKYGSQGLPSLINDAGILYLADSDGKRLAVVNRKTDPGVDPDPQYCDDWIVELMYLILTENLCLQSGKVIMKLEDDYYIEFIPVGSPGETPEEFRQRLLCLAWYYPVVKKAEMKSGKISWKYCVEIKYPEFNICSQKEISDLPCQCEEAEYTNPSACYIAWQSQCCYSTCTGAMNFYKNAGLILADRNNYRAVFDCTCGPYGIALHHEPDIKDCTGRKSGQLQASEPYQVIALNPQCYPTPEMACDAVERAKRIINDEGLHLVEHILLRPHCEKDCDCEFYKKDCENKTQCEFTWNDIDKNDPCDKTEPVCFVPGADPYSFIATVVLPAWPERFRKKENRRQIENILQREAPAHVLLRILWLTPHDLCCFEKYYKQWILWLAGKKQCNETFSICDFLEFLFNRNFECQSECMVCRHCEDDPPETDPCQKFIVPADYCVPPELFNYVNELFCWKQVNCCGYEYTDCVRTEDLQGEGQVAAGVVAKPIIESESAGVLKTGSGSSFLKSKPAFVNQRLKKYKDNIHHIASGLKNNTAAGMAQSFLNSFNPSAERLIQLADEILKNMVPVAKGKKARLDKKQAEELLKNSICHYLDKVSFNGKDIKDKKLLGDAFNKIKKAGISMLSVFRSWQPQEVKKYEQDTDTDEIQWLLTGTRNK